MRQAPRARPLPFGLTGNAPPGQMWPDPAQ